MKNILLLTDFSDCCSAAVDHATTFAEMYHARLHVLHVAKDLPQIHRSHTVAGAENIPTIKGASIEEEMAEFVERWLPRRPGVIQATRHGQAYKEIVKYANEENIDLVVIASHGRTGLTHLLTGSVAEKVVRFSTVPVFIVKPPKLTATIAFGTIVQKEISEMGIDTN